MLTELRFFVAFRGVVFIPTKQREHVLSSSSRAAGTRRGYLQEMEQAWSSVAEVEMAS